MKSKSWNVGLFLMLLAGVSIVARVYYVINLMEDVTINEEIYQAARVSADKVHFSDFMSDGVNIKSIYVCSLYAAFLVFGNFTIAGVYLNLVYQVIALLFLFVTVKNLSNSSIALGVGLVVSVLPVYIGQMAHVTSFDLAVALGTLLLAVLSGILKIILAKRRGRQMHSENEAESPQMPPPADYELKPVMDTSMKEIRLVDLEEEHAVEEKVNYIENPLPVPKRKQHKEMDFEKVVVADNDDFDLKEIADNDDFDIK